MVFLIRTFYENIGIPKSQISWSFIIFSQEYIKKMIEYYVQMQNDELLQIDNYRLIRIQLFDNCGNCD